ncbi:MAG TPA: DUF1874 domain-containing protein [Thermodesulfobacteriota bacterium]|nr:DUF1874 domain-containing protein [Thermodesulfobacteriota bacterium]
MKIILDSATITAFGVYSYSPLSLEEMKEWLDAGDWESNIADPKTCKALGKLLGIEIPVSSKKIRMRPGDEALVLGAAFLSGTEDLDLTGQRARDAGSQPIEVRDDIDVRLWDYHLYSSEILGILRRVG